MHLGIIGLGKMGANMLKKLQEDNHTVIGYDADTSNPLCSAQDIKDLVKKLPSKRIVWLMVPYGKPLNETMGEALSLLESGDYLIDGGNTKYTESIEHNKLCARKGIKYVDVGVSGGVWGLKNGYALMAGGKKEDVDYLMPIFNSLKPKDEYGFVHAGEAGAGHFVKMIHNGIEYAMMQSYAEGFDLIRKSELVDSAAKVMTSWRSGTVIRSWLLDLLSDALEKEPDLLNTMGSYVADSGEGRWTVEYAVENKIYAPLIAEALFNRFSSQDNQQMTNKVISLLRNCFGGHSISKKS